jgi:hypothetical protein
MNRVKTGMAELKEKAENENDHFTALSRYLDMSRHFT